MVKRFFFFLVFLFSVFSDPLWAEDIYFFNPGESFWVAYTYPVSDHTEVFIQEFANGEWQVPIQVTDGVMPSYSPSIALAPDGTLWVAWVSLDKKGSSIYTKRYKNGLWSKTYPVSEADNLEDSQPCIDVSKEGNAYIVWAGSDGKDDEIYFSFFRKGKWSKEIMVNYQNYSPDIDPSICVLSEKKIKVLWSGWKKGRYASFFSKRKLTRFQTDDSIDLNVFFPSKAKEFYSLVFNGSLKVFFYVDGDFYVAFTGDKGVENVKRALPHKKFLEKLNMLDFYFINQFCVAYLSPLGKM